MVNFKNISSILACAIFLEFFSLSSPILTSAAEPAWTNSPYHEPCKNTALVQAMNRMLSFVETEEATVQGAYLPADQKAEHPFEYINDSHDSKKIIGIQGLPGSHTRYWPFRIEIYRYLQSPPPPEACLIQQETIGHAKLFSMTWSKHAWKGTGIQTKVTMELRYKNYVIALRSSVEWAFSTNRPHTDRLAEHSAAIKEILLAGYQTLSGSDSDNPEQAQELQIVLDSSQISLPADGTTTQNILAWVEDEQGQRHTVPMRAAISRPNKIKPGRLLVDTDSENGAVQGLKAVYQTPFIGEKNTKVTSLNGEIVDRVYVFARIDGQEQYRTVKVLLEPTPRQAVTGRVENVHYNQQKGVFPPVPTAKVTLVVQTSEGSRHKFTGTSDYEGNFQILFPADLQGTAKIWARRHPDYIFQNPLNRIERLEAAGNQQLHLGMDIHYRKEMRRVLIRFLEEAGIPEARSLIDSVKADYTSAGGEARYTEDGVIHINEANGNLWKGGSWETIFHEWGHAVVSKLIPDDWNVFGGHHAIGREGNPATAFDEARSHLFTTLVWYFLNTGQNESGLKYTPRPLFDYNWAAIQKNNGPDPDGGRIEDVATAFFLSYYQNRLASDPAGCFRDLYLNHTVFNGHPAAAHPPRQVSDWVTGALLRIWDSNRLDPAQKIARYEHIRNLLSQHHIKNDLPEIQADPNARFSFDPLTRQAEVQEGRVEFQHGRIAHVKTAGVLMEPHSRFVVYALGPEDTAIYLKKGKLEINTLDGEFIGRITDKDGYKLIQGGTIQELPEKYNALLDTDLPSPTPGVAYSQASLQKSPSVVGEIGTVSLKQDAPKKWTTKKFQQKYRSPVIFFGPLSFQGPDPAHIRIHSLESDSVAYKIEEWSYLNQLHYQESASFIVLEKGVHRLTNGMLVEAGTMTTHSTLERSPWERIRFRHDWKEVPAVFVQSQSCNGPDPIVCFVKNVDPQGFNLTLREDETKNNLHTKEQVGYIAVSRGAYEKDGTTVRTVCPATPITDAWQTVHFAEAFSTQPAILAHQQTTNSPDAFSLRYDNLSKSSVDLCIQEGTGADQEVVHTGENFCYAAAGGDSSEKLELPLLLHGQQKSDQKMETAKRPSQPKKASSNQPAYTSIPKKTGSQSLNSVPQDALRQLVVGQWRWFTGTIADFETDGTIGVNPEHTWLCIDPHKRIFRISWSKDKYIDILELSTDGQRLEGQNQHGYSVWAERLNPPAP